MEVNIVQYADSILSNIREGFFAVDKSWNVCYWSSQAQTFLYKSKDETLGKNLWQLFPEAVNSRFYKMYNRAMHTGEQVHFKEYYPPLKKSFHVSAYVMDNLLAVIFQDVTPIERQALELQKLKQQYNIVTHATTQCIWDWEQHTERIYWHGDTLKALLGYDIVNNYTPLRFWMEIIHPDEKEKVIEEFLNAVENGAQSYNQEFRVKKGDGSYIYVQNHFLLMREKQSNRLRMIGSLADVSPKKELEAKLLQAQKASRELFDEAPLPQWIYSRDNLRFLDVNAAALRMYGYTKEEFLQMTPFDIRPAEEHPNFQHFLEGVNDMEGPVTIRTTHLTKSGERKIVESTSVSFPYLNKSARMVTINDLTEKLKLQQALSEEKERNVKEVIEASIKSQEEEKEYIGKELHDNVNQILASTKMFLEVAEQEIGMREEMIQRSKQNIALAIEEIRQLSRSLVLPGDELSHIATALENLVGIYKLAGKFQIHFKYSKAINNLPITLKVTLYRIVQEQLNNIVKHAGASEVNLALEVRQKRVKVTLSDNGKGFDYDVKKVGIGLRNIKTRVLYYNGTFNIHTKPGAGCTMEISIPLKTAEQDKGIDSTA